MENKHLSIYLSIYVSKSYCCKSLVFGQTDPIWGGGQDSL